MAKDQDDLKAKAKQKRRENYLKAKQARKKWLASEEGQAFREARRQKQRQLRKAQYQTAKRSARGEDKPQKPELSAQSLRLVISRPDDGGLQPCLQDPPALKLIKGEQ